MAARSPTVEQDSSLVKLPAELKDRIFELAMSTNTIIAIRAESATSRRSLGSLNCQPPIHAHLSYEFKPTAPPILSVCRELRDHASAMYYGSNIFLLSDVALQPKAFEGFVVARGYAALSAISTVSVSHQYRVMHPIVVARGAKHLSSREWRDTPVKYRLGQVAKIYCMPIKLDRGPEGVVLSTIRSRERDEHDRSMEFLYDADGLCYCKLETLVAERGNVSAQGPSAWLTVLHAYAEAVSEYQITHQTLTAEKSEAAFSQVMKSEDIVAQVCKRCRKVKSICELVKGKRTRQAMDARSQIIGVIVAYRREAISIFRTINSRRPVDCWMKWPQA